MKADHNIENTPMFEVYEFTYDDAIILPGNRWAIDVNFKLTKIGSKHIERENFYTLICSPEFTTQPTQEYKDYIDSKTWVMSFLDKPKIEEKIKSLVGKCSSEHADVHSIYEALKEYFYIDD